MLQIDDSEIDLTQVEAKLKTLECERDYARELLKRGLDRTDPTEATDAGKATHDLSKNGSDCLRSGRAQMVQLGGLMGALEGIAEEEKGMGPAVVVAGMLGTVGAGLMMILEGLVHEVAALRKALEAGRTGE